MIRFRELTTGTRVGLLIIAVTVVVSILAPLITPYDPIATDAQNSLAGASWQHWLGTDQYGRDVLSRTIEGGRFALLVSVLATTVAVAIGTLIGAIAAYYGRWVDGAITRVLDAVLAVPAVLALLLIVSVFGNSLWVLVLAISVVYIPAVARVVRGATFPVLTAGYVTAARARGERSLAVVTREVLPNILDTVLVEFAMRASWVVLLVSTLSFLGFGVNPPTPDWGLMIQENRSALTVAPAGTLAPIVALSLLVVGLNLAADGLGKYLGVDRARRGVL
ncbi:putative ABC transporter permease protein [Microlunatus phosphovorus NM-1]|uniref:Putative ABC transporter permease protein n=1 Tax=Microlunatus phosphovorus (strain ATCC 700054 / DSM 10555 / JCM 9379 / NBRC 101784 / NCIMB 13414 / VKM Ac-1990 / NM-1) TaxID=1032480 RepID=F5XLJ5_MICPN|nr:ABC transporter permease [Microlunatus phosphovorus]BAK36261.1 putative ABC transporter permease protein [Microlunatus phosphovorus NM-1]